MSKYDEPLTQCGKCKEFVELWTFKNHTRLCGNEVFEEMQRRMAYIQDMMLQQILAAHPFPLVENPTVTEILERKEEKLRYFYPTSGNLGRAVIDGVI